MRICDLTTLWLDGSESGVNTYLTEKARYYAERQPGVGHVMIVPGAETGRRKLFGTTIYTVKSPRLPGNPHHRVLARVGDAARLLKEEAPDVVEVDCAYILGRVAANALAGRNVPVIGFYHVHLPTFIARPSAARFIGNTFSGVAERLAWRYVDICYRHCDRLVVSSRDVHDRLGERGFERLEQVPLGVNLQLFRPDAARTRTSHHGNGNGNGNGDAGRVIELLYVGRLAREKELEVLIDAFRRLRERGNREYRLRIVGDGPIRAKLEEQAGDEPRIEFTGMCPYGEELAAIYASADLLVFPSPNETFSLTVLEALASGVPVVAARRGGPTGIVTPEVGELAEPSSPADFAARIEQVVSRRDRYGGCRRHAETHYAWERTFDRLLGVYDAALAARGRGIRSGAAPADHRGRARVIA